MMQPVLRLLQFRERQRVLPAGIRSGLERAQPVDTDGNEDFLRQTVHAVAVCIDRPVLEVNRVALTAWQKALVAMVRAARPYTISNMDVDLVVCRIDLVIVNLAHQCADKAAIAETWAARSKAADALVQERDAEIAKLKAPKKGKVAA